MKEQSPRTLRRELNRMEAWFRDHEHFYTPTHSVLLRAVFEEAKIHHVDVLKGYLREWRLSDAEAEAQKTGTAERIRDAEEARSAWLTAKEEAERQGVPDPPYPLPEPKAKDHAPYPKEYPTPRAGTPAPSTQPTGTAR